MVLPDHQGMGLQNPLGILNLLLFDMERPVAWFTDLGRSASGARHFCTNMTNVAPSPHAQDVIPDKQRKIAQEFHRRFKAETGMAPDSTFDPKVLAVRGSNGAGGAEELIAANHTTRSRHSVFNEWIESTCPAKEDEMILVGQFKLWPFLDRGLKLKRAFFGLLATILFVLLVFFLV